MNAKQFSDQQLHERATSLASRIRSETIRLLKILAEIESRRLFAKFASDSLFDYCVRSLKMSEGAAGRLVNSSRMLARHPDIESDIADGALTITALNSAYIFFKRETKAGHAFCFNRQGEILESLRQKSTREVERILLAHASSQDLHRKERCRQISETVVSLTITLDQVTLEKLESLKSLWSHKMPGANFSQLIAAMADSCLSARELRRPTICRPNRTPAPELEAASSFEFEHQFELDLRERDAATVDVSATGITTAGASESHKRSRHIPSAVRMTVWMRDGGKCGFVDAETGEVCSSRHRLEVDHVLPFASGGAHTVENLRLRCRTHNQWTASQMFGGRATKFRRSFVRELHVAYTA